MNAPSLYAPEPIAEKLLHGQRKRHALVREPSGLGTSGLL